MYQFTPITTASSIVSVAHFLWSLPPDFHSSCLYLPSLFAAGCWSSISNSYPFHHTLDWSSVWRFAKGTVCVCTCVCAHTCGQTYSTCCFRPWNWSAPSKLYYICLTVQAVLAAIIFVNLHGMMKQFMDIPALWRTNKVDVVSVLNINEVHALENYVHLFIIWQ